jgi:hypothetical protein
MRSSFEIFLLLFIIVKEKKRKDKSIFFTDLGKGQGPVLALFALCFRLDTASSRVIKCFFT